ncbi:MAG: hypothetical protein GX580_17725 [Candidatus Hydrogenedens sp.]|nr:hypothetical protein [Candidatus Hydrogenedentota bacterium]NLF59468.1 hypothetical protein [Candidatus Hydrogenedens sp.]
MRVKLFLMVLLVSGAASAVPAGLREVVVVFKTHYDIGYTDLASTVVAGYKSAMIDKALAVCDAGRDLPPERQFVWTLPGWPMAEVLGPGQEPARRARVMDALRAGRFTTHALPFTTHTESLEPEDLVRGLGFASAVAREWGGELPRDAKMTDVPSHSWVLPTLLRHAGVDFLHLGCNAASATPELPPLFWWEGPDGSRLLTRYDGEYGSPLVPPEDWPYPVWLALVHTGDNQGPPSPGDVERLLKQAGRELPGVKVRLGRLSDFADALLATHPEIPVVRGDMPDTWIHGVQSMPRETALARTLRPAITALEQADLLCGLAGVDEVDGAQFVAEAYEHSLLFGEHTWGMDAKQFPRAYGEDWEKRLAAGDYAKLTASWEEKGRHALALEEVGKRLNERVAALAEAFGGWVVFNPLPWPRRLGTEEIPAGGFRVFEHDPEEIAGDDLAVDEAARSIQNQFFRVALDLEQGGISSWIDRRTGRELIAQDGGGGGNYLYQRFGRADFDWYQDAYLRQKVSWALDDFGKPGLPEDTQRGDYPITKAVLRFEREPGLVRAVLEGEAGPGTPHGVTLSVTLHAGRAHVEVACSVDAKPEPLPVAGWLAFHFALEEPRFLLGRLGGVVDPAADLVRGANHDMYCLNNGLAVIGKDGAVIGVCPLDMPLASLGRPGLLHYTRDFQSAGPRVFLNLFNNVWGTNFAQWCGPMPEAWRARLWVMDAENAAEDLARNAWEARAPLVTARGGKPCERVFARAGVAVSKPGVIVTAFGENPDGDGLVLRLWDQSGKTGDCTVTLPEGFHAETVQPCDLRGRPSGSALPVAGGGFGFIISGNAPASFLLAGAGD